MRKHPFPQGNRRQSVHFGQPLGERLQKDGNVVIGIRTRIAARANQTNAFEPVAINYIERGRVALDD